MPGRIAYAIAVLLAFVAAAWAKRDYEHRHGSTAGAHRTKLAIAALVGAVVGSKLGMLLFLTWPAWKSMLFSADALGDGKTIVGGVAGGFLAVELAKKGLGITARTGDVYSVALPLAAGLGRIGCVFAGCCFGRPTDAFFAVHVAGADRHPAPVYEATLLFVIAAVQYATQDRRLPLGHRFRWTLVAMASARFLVEFVRGDSGLVLGPLTAVQWLCLVAALGFSTAMIVERTSTPSLEPDARDAG